jgi:hypothetical protein
LACIAAKYSVSAWGKPSYHPVEIVAGMSAWSANQSVLSFSFNVHYSSYAPRET